MPTEPGAGGVDHLELRPGTRADLAAVHDVFVASSVGPGHPPETRSPEEVRDWVDALLDRPGELWVAAEEGRVVGFVLVRDAWVNLLFVHPDRARRGVGAALLELVKALRPHGFGLRVYQANTDARAFYRRLGLVELERTDGSSHHDHEPDLHMAWLGDDPLAYLRGRIDAVDDELAVLLARRAALTGAVQDHKAATGEHAGERGRDAEREAEIVARMARQVPELGPDRISRVMHTVIAESLAAWEQQPGA